MAVDTRGFVLACSRAANTALPGIPAMSVENRGESPDAEPRVMGGDRAHPDRMIFGHDDGQRLFAIAHCGPVSPTSPGEVCRASRLASLRPIHRVEPGHLPVRVGMAGGSASLTGPRTPSPGRLPKAICIGGWVSWA